MFITLDPFIQYSQTRYHWNPWAKPSSTHPMTSFGALMDFQLHVSKLNLAHSLMTPSWWYHYSKCPVIQLFSTQALELPPPTHKTVRHHYNLQVTIQNSPVQTRTQRLTALIVCFVLFLFYLFIYLFIIFHNVLFLNDLWWLYAL